MHSVDSRVGDNDRLFKKMQEIKAQNQNARSNSIVKENAKTEE